MKFIFIAKVHFNGYASVPDSYAQQTHQFLSRMLSVRISSWCVCSAGFEGTALCAHISTWRECTHQFRTCMLRVRISSWRVCSGYASDPDAHAQSIHQFLTCMLRVCKMQILKIGKIMRMMSMRISIVRVRISYWHVLLVCVSAPDPYAFAQHSRKKFNIFDNF